MINRFPILAEDNLERVCVTDGASNMRVLPHNQDLLNILNK